MSSSYTHPHPDSVPLSTTPSRRQAGLVGASVLVALAALHSAWAAGSSWPAANRDELAERVVGAEEVPGALACSLVAVALGVAAMAVDARTRVHTTKLQRKIGAAITAGTAAALGLRGGVGVITSSLGVGPEAYRVRDLLIYSPLCLALAATLAYANSRATHCPD